MGHRPAGEWPFSPELKNQHTPEFLYLVAGATSAKRNIYIKTAGHKCTGCFITDKNPIACLHSRTL